MNHLECVTSKRNEWYWYLLVLFLCFIAINTVGSLPVVVILVINAVKNGTDFGTLATLNFETIGIDKNLMLVAVMFSFVVMLIAAAFFISLFHGRSWKQVINGTNRVRWSRFFFGFLIWGVISLILFTISYLMNPDVVHLKFQPLNFFILLIISLIFVPVQSTAEEFVFRGYITQGVASWTRSRWWALIIPGMLFGLMHSANPEVFEYGFGIMMTQYIFMGFMFGVMTILDDGIELAMGVHTVNNLLGSVFATYKASALQTYALFEITEMNPREELAPFIISGIVLLAVFAVKYKWNFHILNRKILINNK
jgi:membrane protease YdiL (CAAX protease family)